MIASILTAIGMAISFLVEALLPSSVCAEGGKPLPKNEKGLKELIRNKLIATRRLGVKAAEALLGIIGVILSWILNRAAAVVG